MIRASKLEPLAAFPKNRRPRRIWGPLRLHTSKWQQRQGGAWRSVRVGVPTRVENSPGGGAERLGGTAKLPMAGLQLPMGPHAVLQSNCSIAGNCQWDNVCVQPVELGRIGYRALRGTASAVGHGLASGSWVPRTPGRA